MKMYELGWWLRPDRDWEWYEYEKTRMSDDGVARELDMNFSSSVASAVFSAFDTTLHVITEPITDYKGCKLFRIWDFGSVANATLYVIVDRDNQKIVMHERVLGELDGGSRTSTGEQVEAALADTVNFFDGMQVYDICDPAGSPRSGAADSAERESTHIGILNERGIFPRYGNIRALPTKQWNENARELITRDLKQLGSKSKPMLRVYCPSKGDDGIGCPILREALAGTYCYKKDASGTITNRIKEEHPYEDVIDCLKYLYLEEFGKVRGRTSIKGGNNNFTYELESSGVFF